jgi:hypothetical protein
VAVASEEEAEEAKSKRDDAAQDNIIDNYRTILSELNLLTTVAVLLFGFLLATASSAGSDTEEWLYAAAMILVATATTVFILPVAYHHIQFPYHDFEKFQVRGHFWIIVGLPMLAAGLYLSLVLAIWSLFSEASVVVAIAPLIIAGVVFAARKQHF